MAAQSVLEIYLGRRGYMSLYLTMPERTRHIVSVATNTILINVKVGITDGYISNGSRRIGDDWPSLLQAGLSDGVGTTVINPGNSSQTYSFSRGHCVLVDIDPSTTSDTIVGGPGGKKGFCTDVRSIYSALLNFRAHSRTFVISMLRIVLMTGLRIHGYVPSRFAIYLQLLK
ncbi:uncharacterized protein LAESUDRAFT_144971 [Laetiporus sulphureus 93-53]|uniref:Uncharacterized protein n=1 Tax=Laetiporus sulphureus 93-53 TaxID=1314785 RepID=A0A165EAJ3_9APHY|nr:uncharacterized protein LAESUDRAFT_144971 [Laetiporus sulphureus 93-53]KZT06597.1 hypothetical protein LAESUDRAFT_144971 [Laetiporus sulphureus 93-53]